MNLEFIKTILEENQKATDLFKRNIIKEYLQVLILSFIYSQKNYQNLIFYGGSCLRHCFDLPRLSEDLDFIDLTKKMNLENLANEIKNFLKKEIGVGPKIKIQKFRIYLKFSILYQLNLVKQPESNLLNVKIEIFQEFGFCHNYKTEIIPLFKFGKSTLIKTLDLPSLMSTKIRAILYRKWEKTNKKGKVLIRVKGRDYFDLMWYLEKGIQPNLKCIDKNIKNQDLKKELLRIIKNIDSKSINYDLEGLIKDEKFIKNLSKSIKVVLERQINEKL